jgi:CopG family nickel-responsive transcriptional regulator
LVVKTGVSLPEELCARLQRLAESMGYSSISRAIRDAVELFIAFNSWWSHRGRLRGVIVVAVTDMERAYGHLKEVMSKDAVKAFYVEKPAVREKPALLYLHVAGDAAELKDIYKSLTRIRGIAMVQPVFVPD